MRGSADRIGSESCPIGARAGLTQPGSSKDPGWLRRRMGLQPERPTVTEPRIGPAHLSLGSSPPRAPGSAKKAARLVPAQGSSWLELRPEARFGPALYISRSSGRRCVTPYWCCREGALYSLGVAQSYARPYRLRYPGRGHFVWRVNRRRGMTRHTTLMARAAAVGLARRSDASTSDADVVTKLARTYLHLGCRCGRRPSLGLGELGRLLSPPPPPPPPLFPKRVFQRRFAIRKEDPERRCHGSLLRGLELLLDLFSRSHHCKFSSSLSRSTTDVGGLGENR
ncbi:hypothetical protein B296_00008695 [Ensete ventricosum]|uniref:Uncharacterized protein n=1 Tax=Ensete ventricosum TaxID=4639 RepID=A0A426ZCU9_ENSVE|nr:hypothetical protein B296_00008695 [Ensete ventricosum]